MTTTTQQTPVTESETDKFRTQSAKSVMGWLMPMLASICCMAIGALGNHAFGMEKRMAVQEEFKTTTSEQIRQLGERMDRRLDKLEDKLDQVRHP
jgi:hypothetical protein